MSVQVALQFIQQVRKDESLKSQLQVLSGNVDLETLVKIGNEAGFTFTSQDLQNAYKQDWAMRWFRYGINR